MEYVVDAKDVGKEQAIEQAALQRARERHPVIEIGVMRRLIARVRPHAVLDMADTVHVEGVEADLSRHGLRRRGQVEALAAKGVITPPRIAGTLPCRDE